MATTPPVPPRPHDYHQNIRQDSLPPPIPPLPPSVRLQEERYNTPSQYESQPHWDLPLVAPRPNRLDPSIPENMARNLDDHLQQQSYGRSPQGINHNPGFAIPSAPVRNQSFTSQHGEWSPWGPQQNRPPSQTNPPYSLQSGQKHPLPLPPPPPPLQPPSPPKSVTNTPSLTAPIPTVDNLQGAVNVIQNPNHDPALRIAWCRDILFLVHCNYPNSTPSTDLPVGPLTINDPQLAALVQLAIPIVMQFASMTQTPLPAYVAEAVYMRATFAAGGWFPEFVRHNPRTAFRDFETAARAGYAGAWLRLGRDYETFNDMARGKDCYERGVKLEVEGCIYRMGMAHLLGQLNLPPNSEKAIPLLHRAATLSSLDAPQPAYVYALLLLQEFTQVTVPISLFSPFIPPGSSPALEARKHLERSAYLHFGPAQYKLGHAYEFAQPPFPFDPLLSVQYYSLASQKGEVEADMALSKWFLCGSGTTGDPAGGFEKDEGLAYIFAEKAAKKGLPSAEFAMGYYAEVGVGRKQDVETAIYWYTKAHEHGNADAGDRLNALSRPSSHTLTRQEHDAITENKLVRTRTQAKNRSDGQIIPMGMNQLVAQQQQMPPPRPDPKQVVEVIRRNSLMKPSTPPVQAPVTHMQPITEVTPPPQQQQPIRNYESLQTPTPQYTPPGPNNHLRPQKQQQYPSQQRYTLTDAPVQYSNPSGPEYGGPVPGPAKSPFRGAGSPASRYGPNAVGSRPGKPAGGGSPVAQNADVSSGPATGGDMVNPQTNARPPGKGPATFADMGIQGVRAGNENCVVM